MKDVNKKFVKSWKNLNKLETSTTNDASTIKQIIKEIENLKKYWPEGISDSELSDILNTTKLKLSHTKELGNINKLELEDIFQKETHLGVVYTLTKMPKNKREDFWNGVVVGSGMRKDEIIRYGNEFVSKMTQEEKDEAASPHITILKNVELIIWKEIIKEAKSWNMSVQDKKRIEIFGRKSKKTREDWDWLKDQINDRISKGTISTKDENGLDKEHHKLLIQIFKHID